MNTEININQLNKILKLVLVVALLLISCEREQNHSITFTVHVQLDSAVKTKAQLIFDFASEKEQTILMDWTTLSIYDPSFERESLLSNNTDFKNLMDSLQYPQFVIENGNNEMKFFSDVQIFEGEHIQMKSEFLLERHIDTLKILSKKPVRIESELMDVNRLKVADSDNTIRLHYLFKPTEEQQFAGFKPLILTSNWFRLTN